MSTRLRQFERPTPPCSVLAPASQTRIQADPRESRGSKKVWSSEAHTHEGEMTKPNLPEYLLKHSRHTKRDERLPVYINTSSTTAPPTEADEETKGARSIEKDEAKVPETSSF